MPPIPDRIAELRRQRALVAEHLAWLDAEIARAATATPPPAWPVDQPSLLRAPPPQAQLSGTPAAFESSAEIPAPPPALPDQRSNRILDEYRVSSTDVQRDVRKGCLLYFAAALLVVAAGVTILYFALSR